MGLLDRENQLIAKKIAIECGAIQISSDIIRKQLFSIPLFENSNSTPYEGIYTPQSTEKTYNKLLNLAKISIKAGFTVIIDATFLLHRQRLMFYNLAKLLKVPFYILYCRTNDLKIIQRIKKRNVRNNNKISEANSTILEHQKKLVEPLLHSEQQYTLVIDDKLCTLKSALDNICSQNN